MSVYRGRTRSSLPAFILTTTNFYSYRYYLRNLEGSDLHNMSVFRIVSLFLENRTNTNVKSFMQKYLPRIPSHKYVTILPQLVPHIVAKEDYEFGGQITAVVLRCAKEHPHHTLPLILALINGNRDKEYCGHTTNTDCNENRVAGAKFLIGKLSKETDLKDLIDNMMKVDDALIELAYVKRQETENRVIKIPASCKIRKLRDIENVLVPTVTLPVNKSGNYRDIIGKTSILWSDFV